MNLPKSPWGILFLAFFALTIASCTPADNGEPQAKPGSGEETTPDITVSAGSTAVFSDGLSFDYKGTDTPVTVKFTAAKSWSVSANETKSAPSWLHIDPTSGPAGEASVSISADINPDPSPLKADITLKCGKETKTFPVTVAGLTDKVAVEKVALDGAYTPYEMLVDETVTLTATVAPENASLPQVTWSSSHPDVATVSDGLVTAKKLGTTDITATADGVSSTIEVRVVSKKNDSGIRAAYADFIGRWTVTGTEHKWFGKTNTYSYDIQIEADTEGESYLILNWETAASAEDAKYLYFGSTDSRSIYQALTEALSAAHVSPAVKAWYDSEKGQLHIDRQTYYTGTSGVPSTVEFLADVVNTSGHTSEGSWLTRPGDSSDREYTICDFVMQEDGSVNICSHRESFYGGIAFMGYAEYKGYPESKHYNAKFAFPYTMVRNNVPYKVSSITLSETQITVVKGKTHTLTATVLPESALNKAVYWSSSDSSVAEVGGGVVTGKNAGTATVTVTSTDTGVSASCQVTVTDTRHNGHEYVDLGLPSGLMWATSNLGAESIYEPGSFYAWGETATKDSYTNDNYAFGRPQSYQLTKYNTESDKGAVDGKTILEMADDAARVNWGGKWRMPTEAEWKELLDQSGTWQSFSGEGNIGVRLVRSVDGTAAYLYLPYSSHNANGGSSSNTYYWSSETYNGFSDGRSSVYASALQIKKSSSDIKMFYYYRHEGALVRPVFDPNE